MIAGLKVILEHIILLNLWTQTVEFVSAATDKFPGAQSKWLGVNGQEPTRSMPNGTSVQFLAVSISLWDESVAGKDYGRDVIVQFRDAVNYDGETTRSGGTHYFPYMDMQDNGHQDDWGNFGTPTYFIIDPSGIIQYTNLEDQGYTLGMHWKT